MSNRKVWVGYARYVSLLFALALCAVDGARAWMTLVDNDKGKLDAEIRLMAWAVENGSDLIPGTNTAPPPAQEGDIHDFFVRRARLLLKGQVGKLELNLQLGQDNVGSKVLRDDAGFRVKDAFINYKQSEGLQLLAGQFKVPFLRQNLESGFNQLLVDRSLATVLRPAIEGQRDLGGMIWGNHGGFQYRAALFDGSDQEDSSVRSSLRGSSRLSWNFFTPETGLGYTGTTLGRKKILQFGVQGDLQNDRLDSRDEAGFTGEQRDYSNVAVDVFYDQPFEKGIRGLTFEAAWLGREDDYVTTGLDTREIDAVYVQAGLLLPWKIGPGNLQFAGRYERIDTERGATESDLSARTLGVTWFTKDHERKIQLDNVHVLEHPDDLDDDVYRLSLVASF